MPPNTNAQAIRERGRIIWLVLRVSLAVGALNLLVIFLVQVWAYFLADPASIDRTGEIAHASVMEKIGGLLCFVIQWGGAVALFYFLLRHVIRRSVERQIEALPKSEPPKTGGG